MKRPFTKIRPGTGEVITYTFKPASKTKRKKSELELRKLAEANEFLRNNEKAVREIIEKHK